MVIQKILWCIRFPISRLRKCKRKLTMRQIKIIVAAFGAGSCFITLLLYYWHRSMMSDQRTLRPRLRTPLSPRPMVEKIEMPFRHVNLQEIYKDAQSNDVDSFEFENKRAPMVGTAGCQIPVAMVKYDTAFKARKSCGRRAVFLKKVNSVTVQATIKPRIMKKYLRKSAIFHCCYRFISRSTKSGHEDSKILYSKCKLFNNDAEILLESDFINVKCFEYDKRNTTRLIYNDVFGFAKKQFLETRKLNGTNCTKDKYNILMIGMDSMSLSRVVQTMPRTVAYFKDNYWLGFRGYHKVADNTFPNFMAVLAGMDMETISSQCSGEMDKCNDLLIWNKLKEVGYVTAYGEDNLKLPDTFSKSYAFRKQPTHHYARPMFLNGETVIKNSLVCAGKVSSGQQLLNYALDFVLTYRHDLFFGLFWMNSFSHDTKVRPNDADLMFENFFNQLSYTGALTDTFVIFFSDHGVRFGEYRLPVESYYEERMPMFFMWVPYKFKGIHSGLYTDLAINQYRLTTPYDLYNSLLYIKKLSSCDNTTEDNISEGCPNCQNLFEVVSGNRTCKDVAIHEKWCSCHKLHPLDIHDGAGVKSVLHVVSYLQTKSKSIKTQRCWVCAKLSLMKILRIHFYHDRGKNNLNFVVAFVVIPGEITFEATVVQKGMEFELVGSVSIISGYKETGRCTLHHKDRFFCICKKLKDC